ncbi:E3 ubiquitin-protein ligase RHA1B [Prunus yedoensis var. nudiflora]|uniref:E3 ubiquitin-protein ligase RHA1B n=1 Tax=Prunus yedoensis var. nudiflora TaxID=2094558 RepID=A0A314ULR9_PRUYE|nr:E3 ubiquitin-protein ligase RHA1B [Prunus yedoensis var. nudiflora]
MGFPVVGYTELFLPKLFIHTLSLLGFIRKLISTSFSLLGLQDFIEPDNAWADPPIPFPEFHSASALLIREILPVVKFSDLVDPPESCAVCLYEFEREDEIRRLTNCRHIFHKGCVDRWVGYDQKTCPLCRTPFISDDMQGDFNERLWAASGIPDFYDHFYPYTENGLDL